ncbi:Homeobox protein prophet of Pit-1, partial [Ophiophagus hannah]
MNPSNSGKWAKLGTPRGERRKRTIYTKEQVARLTEAFEAHPYPGYEARERLAHQLGIPEARIHVWFQNRRARQPKLSNSVESGESSRQEDTPESRLASGNLDYSSLPAGPVWGDSRPQGSNWTFPAPSQTFQPLEGSQDIAAPSTLQVPAAPVESALPVLHSSWDLSAPSGSGLVPTLPPPPPQHHLLQPPHETYSYPPYHLQQQTPQLGQPYYSTQACSFPDPALSLHGVSELEGPLGLTQGSAAEGEMPQPGFYGNEVVSWENWRKVFKILGVPEPVMGGKWPKVGVAKREQKKKKKTDCPTNEAKGETGEEKEQRAPRSMENGPKSELREEVVDDLYQGALASHQGLRGSMANSSDGLKESFNKYLRPEFKSSASLQKDTPLPMKRDWNPEAWLVQCYPREPGGSLESPKHFNLWVGAQKQILPHHKTASWLDPLFQSCRALWSYGSPTHYRDLEWSPPFPKNTLFCRSVWTFHSSLWGDSRTQGRNWRATHKDFSLWVGAQKQILPHHKTASRLDPLFHSCRVLWIGAPTSHQDLECSPLFPNQPNSPTSSSLPTPPHDLYPQQLQHPKCPTWSFYCTPTPCLCPDPAPWGLHGASDLTGPLDLTLGGN